MREKQEMQMQLAGLESNLKRLKVDDIFFLFCFRV